ncbi:DUF1611 domain-containing protein [Spirillospora sp. NPDC048911]|uniref:DUF1611 domain-containing protein n=1 Tax=Spirillospora sp. NPDC048911 TaxID=3364527 RepID=UPI00371B5473
MFADMGRLVIYAEDNLSPDGKLPWALVRYRSSDVVAVIDSTRAGMDVADALKIETDYRLATSRNLSEALNRQPNTFVIGYSPLRSVFPDEWRKVTLEAISARLNIANPLPYYLTNDKEISEAARAAGVRIWDVRKPPGEEYLPTYQPHRTGSHVVLTVGSDQTVGKMTAGIELNQRAIGRHLNSAFLATGQTGMLVSGDGLPADQVVTDYLTGHVERWVLQYVRQHDLIFVEGQGALNDLATSSLNLGMIHGTLPDSMIFCHRAGATAPRQYPQCKFPPLRELLEMNETAANWFHHTKSSKVVGITVNTQGLSLDEAKAELARIEDEVGLPATDVIRFGSTSLLDAVLDNAAATTGTLRAAGGGASA